MSEETIHLVERLRRRLRRTVRRLTLGELAFGLVVTLGGGIAFWLASAALEAGVWMQPGARTLLVSVASLVVLALFGTYVARPLLRLVGLLEQPSDEEAARHVGHHFPEIADRFVNLLQLADRPGETASAPLTERAVSHLGQEVEDVPFEHLEDFSRARRASRWAIVPIAGLLIFLLAAPGAFLDASGRLLSPTIHFQRPAPFQLALAPEAADLVKGDSLTVTVRAQPTTQPQRLPSTLTLQTQATGEEHIEDLTLTPADSGGTRFQHVFTNVRSGFRYRAVAEANGRPLRTGWHEARVAQRPRIDQLQVTLTPPAYSGLPERSLAPGTGDVTALPGTRVAVEAQLAGPTPEQALLRFSDGSVDTLSVGEGELSGAFTLTAEGTYQFALRSANGARNADPIPYHLQTTSDAAPTVSLHEPAPEAALSDALRPQLRWQMSDDFGFAQQKLYYRLAERRHGQAMETFRAIELPTNRPNLLDQEVTYDWLLRQTTDLDLVPGDVIEYYVRVWDNNRVAGYQSARTATHRLRLPSLTEKYEKLDETQSGVKEEMDQLEEQSESMRRQFEGLREELQRKREGDWEDQRQVEQLKQKQEQLQQGAKQLSQQIEETARQMQQGQLTSPETQRMYEELKQVARDIQSPELRETLEKLQQAMQEMDMEKMQQALQDFEFNEEQYRERLQRTKELFEKIKAQQKLEEAARRAGELAEEERRLAEETRKLQEQQEEKGKNRREEEKASRESDARKAEQQDAENQNGENQDADQQPSEENADSADDPTSKQTGDEGEQQSPDNNQRGSQSGQKEASQKEASSESEAKREQLAREQERAREKMKELQKEMQKLSEDMKQMRGAPKQQMQQMQKRSQQMPQQMQQNSQQLRQGQLQKAGQGQQQMQKRLEQMQQSLSQMKQGMQQKQKQMNVAGLRQALANTLRLSEDQEALRQRTSGLATGSPALREVTRRQNELAEGLRTTSDSLTALAREIPKMTRAVQKETGESLRAMQQAIETMTGRSSRGAEGHQKAAMKNLNELALLLSQLLQQMQQSQSGQGSGMSAQQMMQKLQQMAGQQQKLNGQVQQMLNDMQGDRLSQSQSERAKQMAQQQKAIQKQLQKLREQGADTQAIGDLQRVAEQMGETISEMQRQRLSRETLKRQQQILSRLLQAQQSLQKRGKKEQRRSQEADGDYTQERPATNTSPEQDAERLRRALIRSLESGYTPDYEQLIKRYFELLQDQRTPDQTESP